MSSTIKLRTTFKNGLTTVRAIIRHPMHTGFEFDPDMGKLIPAHYIKEVSVHHGEKLVLFCDWSRAVSRNPYLSFIFSGAKPDDILRISWKDTKDQSDTKEVTIK